MIESRQKEHRIQKDFIQITDIYHEMIMFNMFQNFLSQNKYMHDRKIICKSNQI